MYLEKNKAFRYNSDIAFMKPLTKVPYLGEGTMVPGS